MGNQARRNENNHKLTCCKIEKKCLDMFECLMEKGKLWSNSQWSLSVIQTVALMNVCGSACRLDIWIAEAE